MSNLLSVNQDLSLEHLLRGEPEIILQATASPKILITWLHANEQHAPRLAHYIYTKRPDLARHVDFICGNPRAAAHPEDLGYVETDLNRSFKPHAVPKSYEEKRAIEILELSKGYDYVLDLHGAVDPHMGKLLIFSKEYVDTEVARQLIAASVVERIMAIDARALKTLNGVMPNSVCVEYSFKLLDEAIEDDVQLLERLVLGKKHTPYERSIFNIDGNIPKTEDPGPEARNFEYWEKGGYYPILLGNGPRSYREDPTKDYCGFYATERKVVKL